MINSEQKNNYQEFLERKRKFAKKLKAGKKFKDTDQDGLSDYEEKNIYGTDPKNPDTDGDGMKDCAEVGRGRNTLGAGRLKDLFIPHAGNDYSPHALRPRRLLFHALSVIAIKSIVVVFVLFYPLSAWLSPDLALAEAKKIIELTNNLRRAVFSPALLENRQLTQAAWQKVEDMAFNQYFAHVNPSGFSLKNWLEKAGYKYAVAGENLAVGFSRPEDVVLAWKNSPTHYSNLIDKDFKEIGVALADGKLNQIDTIFIAQYFARPAAPIKSEPPASKTDKNSKITPPPAKNEPAGETEVKGVSITEAAPEPEKLPEDKIIIDQEQASLSIKEDPLSRTRALRVETILPEDTVSAEVVINSHKINLALAPGEANRWRGGILINEEEEENILNPLIPAGVTVKNSAGIAKYGELDWDKATIIKTTPYERYQLFKANPAAAMEPIMKLSNSYFKLILIIAIIAMLLNIFVEIKKQHPHIIFYSFAFIGLLSAMIIF